MSVVGGPELAEPPRPERRAERDDGTETVGAQKRRLPCDRGADVVAGDHRLPGTQSVDETDDVADVMENRIFLHLLRTVAAPIAAQVGGHRAEPGLRQRPELMPPGIPALGKAVAEDDERTFTLLGHVQADAVRLDHPMRHLGHRRIHPGCRLWASPARLGSSGLERPRESGADGERAARPRACRVGKTSCLAWHCSLGCRASGASTRRDSPICRSDIRPLPASDYPR